MVILINFLSILTIAQASFIALLGAEVIPIDSNLRKALIILLGLLTAAFQLLGTFLPVRKRVIRRADSYFEVMGKAYVLRRKLQNLQAQVETEVAEKLPGIRDEFYALNVWKLILLKTHQNFNCD